MKTGTSKPSEPPATVSSTSAYTRSLLAIAAAMSALASSCQQAIAITPDPVQAPTIIQAGLGRTGDVIVPGEKDFSV